jgi:hypothetical protein
LVSRKGSEFIDHIHPEEQLISALTVVVSPQVPRVVKTKFGTKHDRAADVFRGIEGILRVLRRKPGALAFLSFRKSERKPNMSFELISRLR